MHSGDNDPDLQDIGRAMPGECAGVDHTASKGRQAGRPTIDCRELGGGHAVSVCDKRQALTEAVDAKTAILSPLQGNAVLDDMPVWHSFHGDHGGDGSLGTVG